MILMMMTTMMIMLQQPIIIKRCNASKQTQQTTYTKRACLQVRTAKFPGKQLDSRQQGPEGASVEPRHVHAYTIADPIRFVSHICDEERTRACGLPAPAFNSRSNAAAGSSMIEEPGDLEKFKKV